MEARRTKHHAQPDIPGTPAPQPLLDKAAGFYHDGLADDEPAITWLRDRGLAGPHLLDAFRIGYCGGRLSEILPSPECSPQVHVDMKFLGVLKADGREALLGMLTAPILDSDGGTVGIVGLDLRSGAERLIGMDPPRIWNAPAGAVHAELIAATSVLDGLALVAADIPNVIAFVGEPGSDERELLAGLGVVSLAFATPDAGAAFATHLSGIRCFTLTLPDHQVPSSLLKALRLIGTHKLSN